MQICLNWDFKDTDMEIKTTKKAANIISTFTAREKGLYDYLIELLTQDMVHIKNCYKEISIWEDPIGVVTTKSQPYRTAIKETTKGIVRLKYIFQTVELYVYDDLENMVIDVKTINDK